MEEIKVPKKRGRKPLRVVIIYNLPDEYDDMISKIPITKHNIPPREPT